jgi:hypothetical protein
VSFVTLEYCTPLSVLSTVEYINMHYLPGIQGTRMIQERPNIIGTNM